jgi:hypothetical protein
MAFDPAAFKLRYPEFAGVSDATLGYYYTDAELYLNPALITNVARQQSLMWMLVAHIAMLSGALSADGLPLAVGRLSSASEGSVSISTEYAAPGSAEWFSQTQYGAMFWAATASLRGMRYVARPTSY